MNQTFKKIQNEDSLFYINAKFDRKLIELVVLQGNKAWTCFITEAILNEWCKQYQMPITDYYNTLKEYLNSPPSNVSLCLNNGEFVIYRSLSKGRTKFFLGALEEIDYANYVEKTLIAFYNENQEYKNKIATLEAQQKNLETINLTYATKLQEFIERKECDDEQLYSNFVRVLNEKKRKIQHLTELLEAFRNGRQMMNPSSVGAKRRKRQKNDGPPATTSTNQRKEVISESEESSCEEIEEEMAQEETTSSSDHENGDDTVEKEELVNTKTDDFHKNSDNDDDFLLPKRIKNTEMKAIVKTASSLTQSQQIEIRTVPNEKQQPSFDTQELLDNI